MDQKTQDRLNQIIKNALYIRSELALGTRSLTPINYNQEKEKFLKAKTGNPKFKYHAKKPKVPTSYLVKMKKDLEELKLPKDLEKYLKDVIDELILLTRVKEAVGTEKFPKLSSQLLKITQKDIDHAFKNLPKINFTKPKNKNIHTAVEIKSKFQNHLKTKYSLSEFEVLIDNFNHFTIWQHAEKIAIGNGIKRSSKNVDRLIVHEVESHFLRSHNHSVLKNPLQEISRYGEFLTTTEGLAVYNEIATATITKSALGTYKNRLRAARNLNLSFREIYNDLLKYTSKKQAFTIAYRAKRGMSDTSKPGGHKKDTSYLLGYLKIKDFVEKGGKIEELYAVNSPTLLKILKKHNLTKTSGIILPKFLL